MALQQVEGDVRLTGAQALLLGVNARGRVEVNPLEITLRDQYPVFYSEQRRMAKSGRLSPGQFWVFREAQPWLVAGVVRQTAGGITRARYLEQLLLNLRRLYQDEQLRSLAIAPLAPEPEWSALRQIILETLHIPMPVFVYTQHLPGQQASEAIP